MICAMKLANSNIVQKPQYCECERLDCQYCECERLDCQWWNERFGMCCIAVDAYLKGQEDWQREKEIVRRGGER